MEIAKLKGMGKVGSEKFHKKGIKSIMDLIFFYPLTYKVYDGVENFSINGEIEQIYTFKSKRNTPVTRIKINDQVIFAFNQKYLQFNYKKGDFVYILASSSNNDSLVLDQIDQEELNIIVPVYSYIKGISNYKISEYIMQGLELEDIKEVPYLKEIHSPTNLKKLSKAIEVLKEIEFREYLDKINELKQVYKRTKLNNLDYNELDKFKGILPYNLTSSQEVAIKNCISNINGEELSKTLIYGEVGSGKTIVSLALSYLMERTNKQTVILAPTEILAMQIFNQLEKLNLDIEGDILLGSNLKRDKNRKKQNLEVGLTKIIVSTHAILEDDVRFKDLGLVIIDEQQRFGVEQREKLLNENKNADLVYLTATPIPRTLSMVLYDILSIEKLEPIHQSKIETKHVVTVLEAMEYVQKNIDEEQQIYVVVPSIEKNELIDLADINTTYKYFGLHYNGMVGKLHGGMKSADKTIIMEKFLQKEYNILVTTSIIEVGIDVPDASCILIINSERFGISQLHQLRGRVGRSGQPANCILISNTKNKDSLQRLKMLEEFNDGIVLSQQDLLNRGSGDLFGIKQSGLPDFRLFNINEDVDIIKKTLKI